jgi:hypothetical protein
VTGCRRATFILTVGRPGIEDLGSDLLSAAPPELVETRQMVPGVAIRVESDDGGHCDRGHRHPGFRTAPRRTCLPDRLHFTNSNPLEHVSKANTVLAASVQFALQSLAWNWRWEVMATLRYGGEHEQVRAERWPAWGEQVVAMCLDAWEGREWALLHPDEAEEDGSVGRY